MLESHRHDLRLTIHRSPEDRSLNPGCRGFGARSVLPVLALMETGREFTPELSTGSGTETESVVLSSLGRSTTVFGTGESPGPKGRVGVEDKEEGGSRQGKSLGRGWGVPK